MTKARGRKLKVFQAQFGFFDTVVAAPSRAAALLAWDTHQDLFTNGQARVCEDAQGVAAALAHPGVILRRAVGSKAPFAVEAAGLPKVPKPDRKALSAPAKAKKRPPARAAAADRSKLDAAEAALRELDDGRKREETRLARRQDDLDRQARSAQAAYSDRRKAAEAAVTEARRAFRKAGGKG